MGGYELDMLTTGERDEAERPARSLSPRRQQRGTWFGRFIAAFGCNVASEDNRRANSGSY